MFGDYEAQRHWQEVTLNLPIDEWYTNTTDNDLRYWGLDYPPLTAYHSFALGYIADKINSSYVKLHESRGISSEEHKYFMRLTVLCADIFVYVPSLIYFVLTDNREETAKGEFSIFSLGKKHIVLLNVLMYPGLILIDHGHFQYNCASLGLFVAAVAAMLRDSFIIGSFLFVAALNYKQMELYHALPIFFYILGKYSPLKGRFLLSRLRMLLCVSFAVVVTFAVLWLPFLRNVETFTNVIFRLFPVARGVFEDKVANIWCAVNVLYKLQNGFTNQQLAKVCLALTTFAALPSCVNVYRAPEKEKFIISLINCSLAFFLFSFQVHEKSILLVAVPVLLHFRDDPFPCFWFLIVSQFSMLPLFIKDDLYVAYCATTVFYFCFTFWSCPDIFSYDVCNANSKQSIRAATSGRQIKMKLRNDKDKSVFAKVKRDVSFYCKNRFDALLNYDLYFWIIVLFCSSILGIIILSSVSGFLNPPKKYPDLFALLVSMYSCGHFIIFYLYFNYKQLCT